MFTIRLRIAVALLLTIAILAVWGAIIPRAAHSRVAPAPASSKAPKQLLEKRYEEVKRIWDMKWDMFSRVGRFPPLDLLGWSERLLDAELALHDDTESRAKALKAHVERTRDLERITIVLAKMGSARDSDIHLLTYDRLNAEIRYCEATGKLPPPFPNTKKVLPKPDEKGERLPNLRKGDQS